MKNVLILLLLSFFSCKSGQEVPEMATNEEVTQEKMILSYAKGACLGNCPVYDLRILENGKVVYQGIRNVRIRGAVKLQLSKEELGAFSKLLENLEPPKAIPKIRDKPITSLRCNEQQYSYYATRIDGNLKGLNDKLEALVTKINKAPPAY